MLCIGLAGCTAPEETPWEALAPEVRARYFAGLEYLDWADLATDQRLRDLQLARALEEFEAVAAASPRMFRARRAIQDILLELDPSAARERFLVPADSGDPEKLTLAARLLAPVDAERARQYLELAVEADPEFAWARYGLAFLDWQEGRDEPALDRVLEALARDPGFPEARELEARLYESLGRRDEALASYRRLLETKDTVELRYRYANLLLRSDDEEDAEAAEEQLRQVIERATAATAEPDPELLARATLDLGVALADQRRPEPALEMFHRALELDPELLPAWYNIGWVLEVQMGLPEEALEAYRHYEEAAAQAGGELPAAQILDRIFYVPENIRRLEERLQARRQRTGEGS
jgi:tetratricopeptide (TPR) repeat protein